MLVQLVMRGMEAAALVRDEVGSDVEQVRIVLCMIVKNEAGNIQRCLRSALSICDGYVICDTGSNDGTIAEIEQVGLELGCPGTIESTRFVNFGFNRSQSEQAARAWVTVQGWNVDQTYLLLLDADMVLHPDTNFDKQALVFDSYKTVQDDGTLRYYNTRLVSLARGWHCVGVTHEYWAPIGEGVSEAQLHTLWIEDVGDGGSKENKFARDIQLLRQTLMRKPQDQRSLFYLAQSYYDVGRFSEAAKWYEQRVRQGGWHEECWYALYKQGLCFFRIGHERQGVALLLEAFDLRPQRAEPLKALAQHYRAKGQNHTAMMFALQGLQIQYPEDDVLFVEKQVYEWRLWEEIMIAAFYAGEQYRELGFFACESLTARRGHDEEFYNYVRCNEVFYTPKVSSLRFGTFQLSQEFQVHDGVEYLLANPTVVNSQGRIFVNVRLLNYQQKGGRSYEPFGSEVFLTRNVVFEWLVNTSINGADAECTRLMRGVVETLKIPSHWSQDTQIQGLEDVRFTFHQMRIWFAAACNQVPGHENECRVVLGRLSADLSEVEHLVSLKYDQSTDYEKNWLPWSRGDDLLMIYGYDPFLVLRVDPENGNCIEHFKRNPEFNARDFRGSASPLAIPGRPGRWLALVHEVAYRQCGNVYSHRFIEIDEEEGLISYSRPFFFDEASIEYSAGFCSLDEVRLLVTYGHEDRQARWVELSWEDVLGSLRPGETGRIVGASLMR